MTAARVSQVALEPVRSPVSAIARAGQVVLQPVHGQVQPRARTGQVALSPVHAQLQPRVRSSQLVLEPLHAQGAPRTRVSQLALEGVHGLSAPRARLSALFVDVVRPNRPDLEIPAIQLSTAVRRAALDAYELVLGGQRMNENAVVGTHGRPWLRLYVGEPVRYLSLDPVGTKVAEIQLPEGWCQPATVMEGRVLKYRAADLKLTCTGAGVLTHYRIYDAYGVCHEQGLTCLEGGEYDLEVDAYEVTQNQVITASFKPLLSSNS